MMVGVLLGPLAILLTGGLAAAIAFVPVWIGSVGWSGVVTVADEGEARHGA